VGGDLNIWGGELNADLAILDSLGAATNVAFNVNTAAIASIFPEVVYRGSSGTGTVTLTLPAPGSIPVGKIFTVKKVDAAVGVIDVIATIDGLAGYVLLNQYQYVRVQNNGTSYDVIGNN
jgi:hypothetical protein